MSHVDRLPVVFLPHGGGPWPYIDGIGGEGEKRALTAYLRSLRTLTAAPPKALLVISAHWEERVPTVMTSARPPLLFDYTGFPAHTYELQWPAPGDPALAARVRALLASAGIDSAENATRGFDHGTFIPLGLTFPDAEIPTVQLSLQRGLDPAAHLAIGRALAPLRSEGVLIVGSGMSFHNMRGFGAHGRAAADAFDAWLADTATAAADVRAQRLVDWTGAPAARQAHPREEHLLPLMVVAGAAGDDAGRIAYNEQLLGVKVSAFHFGG